SAHAWPTPPQVALTAGLCDAVCDGMLVHSARRTVARIDHRAGAEGLLSKTTVLEIVHDQGRALPRLVQARAAGVWEQDLEAAAVWRRGRAAAALAGELAGAGSRAEPAGRGDPAPSDGPSEGAEPAGPGPPAAAGPGDPRPPA